jgi:hypothetical protein
MLRCEKVIRDHLESNFFSICLIFFKQRKQFLRFFGNMKGSLSCTWVMFLFSRGYVQNICQDL